MVILTRFRKILFVRFVGYLFIFIGLLIAVLIIEPVLGEESKYRLNQIFGRQHILPQVITSLSQEGSGQSVNDSNSSSFGDIMLGSSETIVPVSTDFGIVIEKINANAKVVANVDPSSERDYSQALASGVAHAKGTKFPGETGNIYLFSHSVDAPWNIVRYNAIFYLLGKLEVNDRVILFYQGRRFDYIVFDKAIVKPSDTHFLTDSYEQSVLTLQTCDPPGTLLNRLVVRAKLAGE